MAAMAVVCSACSGCGWSARDEFFRGRELTLGARSGDGSTIAMRRTSEVFMTADASPADVVMGPGRE
jgi:hypothetical protein